MSKRARIEDNEVTYISSGEESATGAKRRRTGGLGLGSSEAEQSDTEPTSVSDGDPGTLDTETTSPGNSRRQRVKRRGLSHIAITGPAYPRSSYDGWEPPMPSISEEAAVADLYKEYQKHYTNASEEPEYTYLRLEDVSIFRPVTKAIGTRNVGPTRELVTLDRLKNRNGCHAFLFDGMLCYGNERRYVRSVPFSTLTIEGYGDDEVTTLRNKICIQSPEAEYREVWYQLGEPSQEYLRFYQPFVWLAQFTKHFVDYLLHHDRVTLTDFEQHFCAWLSQRYGHDEYFTSWIAEAKLSDFRTTIAAHVGFLWKECYSIDDRASGLCKHPIWCEVDPQRLKAIPEQPAVEKHTVVTPFAYECFKHMYFASHMESRPIVNPAVHEAVKRRKHELKLTPLGSAGGDYTFRAPEALRDQTEADLLSLCQGDVVCVQPNGKGWRSKAAVWYAYVQRTRLTREGTVLDVLWLYEPGDTTLGAAYYPFKKELFLSDNCNCGKDAVNISCVTGKVDVTWSNTDPATASNFFVRRKFGTIHSKDTYDFMSLKESDFRCRCDQYVPIFDECEGNYSVNDTVLVREWNAELSEDSLEPAQILAFDREHQRVVLRRLARKSKTYVHARPNELVLTDETINKSPSRIIRRCHVRFVEPEKALKGHLPTPYDRDGAGDLSFIVRSPANTTLTAPQGGALPGTSPVREGSNATPHRALPPPTEGGPTTAKAKMKGMGIFCGGGNFDRGLEEGGAVDFHYAVDWAQRALHSYRANTRRQDDVQFWLGSVNDYLAHAIAGSTRAVIAKVGDFDLLAAGSPCPGFSCLQGDKASAQSLTNASLVASVVSFVDHYNPRYCLLENVTGMTRPPPGQGKDQNVFSQVLAAFVAMGYQVQQFLMDSWSFSSSQHRSRVFIVASAPGSEPVPTPQHTHAHPKDMAINQTSLGESSNGLRFGVRRNDFTPFPHVSASEATKDLPTIGDSQPQLCPSHPDHRTPNDHSHHNRTRMAMVPILPHGSNIVQAYLAGLLSGEPEQYVKGLNKVRSSPKGGCFARVYPDALFQTIITVLGMADGKAGRCLHWQEHRSLTVMETRRAQGFLDHEVLIGSPSDQIKIIGNSVDRNSSFALGLVVRASWEKTQRASVIDEVENQLAAPKVMPPSIRRSSPEMTQGHTSTDGVEAQAAVTVVTTPSTGHSSRQRDEEWKRQSQEGTLRLSNEQVEEVRAGGGFKAIKRILSVREGGEASGTPSMMIG